MGLFHEYLNARGKITEPKVTISADIVEVPNPPTKVPLGKGQLHVCSDGKSVSKSTDGFGDKGDKKLVVKYPEHEKGKAPAKIPTSEQVIATYEIASLVSESMLQYPEVTENLIYEFKKRGVLGIVLAEMLSYPETYEQFAKILTHKTHGPKVISQIGRAVKQEEVAPPYADQLNVTSDPKSEEEPKEDSMELAGNEEPDDIGEDFSLDLDDEPAPEVDPNERRFGNSPTMVKFMQALR